MWRAVLAVGVVVAACAGGVGAESFLQDISRNLRAEMAGVLEMANVTYSVPAINATYRARSEFDMRAMGSLYNSTHLIIDFIANKQAYPEGIVSVADGHVEVASLRDNWRTLLAHYAGPAAVIALAALLAAALPLAGLFWCCCYWCKSGRRRRAFDRKYDGCLKGMLAILLIALLTLFLFGVVCAFATDSQLESGAAAAPAAVRAGFADARTFLHATQAHARHLLTDNYRELDAKINALLTSAGLAVSVQLGQLSRAVSVSALEQLVRRLGGVQQDLRDVHRLTADLRTRADELNAGLRKVKGQLLQTLAQCEQPPCRRLQEKYKIGQLDTEIQYNQMPDVSELLANVTLVLDSNIQEEVADGQRVLTGIQRSVQRAVDTHVPSVQAAVADTGRRLARVADDISAMAGNASLQLQRHERAAAALQRAHQRYGPYRRIAGLGAAAALLAVVLAAALGLTCGVCGKRPDAYGASDCCNKGAGATALLCGTGLMFAVGGAVSCVALAYFAVGVAAQRFVCDPLTEPRGNRLFADVDRFVGLERALFNEQQPQPLTLSAVLQRCHGNHTIYETLQLRRLYDVDALAAEASRELAARAEALSPTYPAGGAVSILRPSARHKLRQLADAGLSDFDFDRILNALETNMTTLSLESLAVQLEDTARAVQPRSGYSRVAADLRAAAQALQQLQRQALTQLRAAHQQLQTTATKLRDGLRFNHTSLKEAVSYLMYETAQAELYLNTQGPELVQNMTRSFAGVVSALMQQYLRRLAAAARLHVGRCGPLSAAFNATRDAACRNILMPTNGYWVSVWWCALLLLPLAGASARLARLYRRVAAYPGPRDTEYLYDAYADRDNIPLANAYKAEKRAGRRARGEAGEGRGGGGAGGGAGAGGGGGGAGAAAAGAGPALAPPLDAHHARRYNDMAPKHWEEGPPRYLGPTEYERPPPYYYPGPNDRQ